MKTTNRTTKYSVNEDFFKVWSPTMAWILGLMFTDGHINFDRNEVAFTSIDEDLLEKFSKALSYTGHSRLVQSKSTAKRVSIYSEKLVSDLVNLGVVPSKTHVIRFPNMPRPFVKHFIRGCFDGDGGFMYRKDRGSLQAHFTSGSCDFMKDMAQRLSENITDFYLGKRKVVISETKARDRVTAEGKQFHSKAYQTLFISAKSSLQELYWFLYDGVTDDNCLSRKKLVFEQYLQDKNLKDIQVSSFN